MALFLNGKACRTDEIMNVLGVGDGGMEELRKSILGQTVTLFLELLDSLGLWNPRIA
jgi:hypothetical protein